MSERDRPERLTRRAFTRAAAGTVLALSGFAAAARAAGLAGPLPSPAVAEDVFQALAAFVLPGDDAWSVVQGETAPGPGGVASGAVPALLATFDEALALIPPVPAALPVAVPAPATPASVAAAAVLNALALTVAPTTVAGPLGSPFARLSFAEKGEVFATLEAAGLGTEVAYLVNAVVALCTFMCLSEVGVRDPSTGALTGTPVGWTLTGFPGPAEGRAALIGYWRGARA